ncbi:MAG: ANTAR domain-containing protein [Bacilli bacterium]|nr:ANTAR domain-containing protein [Bacilli bacterium]
MPKILVCINDNLLKLRIQRLLSEKAYDFTITDRPIKRTDLIQYDMVLIHSTYHLTDLFHFIENVVLQQVTTIVYITTNVSSNPFRRFHEHTNLIFVDEHKMDIELMSVIQMFEKYNKQVRKLKEENQKLSTQLEENTLMNRCKRTLMEQGRSEDQAHKYILKFAMDHHISKIEACNRLLADNSE